MRLIIALFALAAAFGMEMMQIEEPEELIDVFLARICQNQIPALLNVVSQVVDRQLSGGMMFGDVTSELMIQARNILALPEQCPVLACLCYCVFQGKLEAFHRILLLHGDVQTLTASDVKILFHLSILYFRVDMMVDLFALAPTVKNLWFSKKEVRRVLERSGTEAFLSSPTTIAPSPLRDVNRVLGYLFGIQQPEAILGLLKHRQDVKEALKTVVYSPDHLHINRLVHVLRAIPFVLLVLQETGLNSDVVLYLVRLYFLCKLTV